ncbi:farnesyl-diphosphate synthase [Lysinibacillus sp. 2017]|uniref:polyprenyl synthetase family protein n=1 Tax=unclassified Lysinibacillus TaxID=2636778 RepID=UPI000D52A537|nr:MULTISPECIES: farnesyl diphosphate synthase [unclassified Lysinibacillus]AWE07912.1 farnesyl-diphosphate synthase [Lysinibacillus sp. 2017]TGN33140.1 polyprenyl synthetase family protein [Lysinibacillus sp. S2017]
MENTLKHFIDSKIPEIENVLFELVEKITAPAQLKESMLYSLKAGGKRIRPLFVSAVCEMYKQPLEASYTVGSAIEMIHTYSLIHDDLPCMDDDELRRGKPTNHVVYGEDVATLAGDALNTLAFGVLARLQNVAAEKRIELVDLLSVAAGAEGMVGGQILDMDGEKRLLNLQELETVHVNKTGALLRYSIESGAVLAGASVADRQALVEYAHHIGLAFQIQDDILDIEGTSEQLGKTAGKDVASEKSTYPALLTLDGAKQKLDEHYHFAIEALQKVEVDTSLLQQFAQYIVRRTN